MNINGYEITPKNVVSYLRGNANEIFNLLEDFEKDQVELRALLCIECTQDGKCSHCKCKTPSMYYDQSKECKLDRWGKMMNKTEWEDFMQVVDLHQAKSSGVPLNKEFIAKLYSIAQANGNKLSDPNDPVTLEVNDVSEIVEADIDSVWFPGPSEDPDNYSVLFDPAPIRVEGDPFNKNVGKIFYKMPYTHTFKFKNSAPYSVAIARVVSGCKCTGSSAQVDTDVKPGDDFVVTLTYDAKALGRFTKSTSVYFHQTQVQPVTLILQGEVIEAKLDNDESRKGKAD